MRQLLLGLCFVLLQHMTEKVPRLRGWHPEVPRAIDDLIQHLLRKDPRDRYQSAQSALNDLESIAAWKANAEHLQAQRLGHEKWYAGFKTRIARVERDYGM